MSVFLLKLKIRINSFFRGLNDILVPPEMNKEIQEMLEYESIPFEVAVWDLEKAIKYENPIMSRRQKIELEKEQGHPMNKING